MSFMQPQIKKGSWLLVDGNCGIDVVPADLWSKPVLDSFGHTNAEWTVDQDSEGFDALCALVADYVENTKIYSIELKRGYGARLSAPGYMDCTHWSVFDTEEEAEEHLAEMYGDDDAEE